MEKITTDKELNSNLLKSKLLPIKKFINNTCKNKPNIQKVILFIQDNYLDIWFLVEKANIEASYNISKITFDVRKHFLNVDFDFMVIDLTSFSYDNYIESEDYFKLYDIKE